MSVPADRLTAADLRDYVDRAEAAFADGDQLVEVEREGRLRVVFVIDERITQLERVIAHMRDPCYSEAMELLGTLKRARISRSIKPADVCEQLRQLISDWDAARQSRRRAA
jgi:hypothetical protein